MHPFVQKTLGGLSKQYYFRQIFFGIVMSALFLVMVSQGDHPVPIFLMIFLAINTLLYPYSRFVYESAVGFIMGENVFFVNAIFMLFAKLFTMMMCWGFAIFIAPIGLVYLYFHHGKAERAMKEGSDV